MITLKGFWKHLALSLYTCPRHTTPTENKKLALKPFPFPLSLAVYSKEKKIYEEMVFSHLEDLGPIWEG